MRTFITQRWPDLMMGAYSLGSVGVGIAGISFSPSPTLTADLGAVWVWFYSALLIVGGLVAFAGIVRGTRRATMWAIIGLAFATLIHGISITAAGSWQTGLRLAIAPLMMVPTIIGWNFWMTWRSLHREGDTK